MDRAGQADYGAGIPPTAHADLGQQYGVKKGVAGRVTSSTRAPASATWR